MVETGGAIGLDAILPYSVLHRNNYHRRLEVRLGRGISHGNTAPKPKPMDTSPPNTTTQPINQIAVEFYERTTVPQPSLPIYMCKRITRRAGHLSSPMVHATEPCVANVVP